ncbi:MAG: universal stress protein [Deltaproteobacteria bacterium]|nr:universal stress protein [Deltaproteobacteria bacterium]MBW2069859.1 universal stress protein [Deltaproteobacteria bacterium]
MSESTYRVRRILLPLKFSHVTDNAFATALRLAKCCQARLHILHVLDHRLRQPEITEDEIAEITKAAEKEFQERYLPRLEGFKDYAFNCWEGDPAMETAKLADSIGADFIVVGCHTRRDRPSPTRLGEVALALLQWAPCPVTVVPCEIHR